MGRTEILEHPADVGFRASGVDLADALDAVVAGLARVETGDAVPAATERRSATLDADDEESLVVALLEECLYLRDAADWLAIGARVSAAGEGAWAAELSGAPAPTGFADRGVHVKAITWHQLAVRRVASGVEITVFVDI